MCFHIDMLNVILKLNENENHMENNIKIGVAQILLSKPRHNCVYVCVCCKL